MGGLVNWNNKEEEWAYQSFENREIKLEKYLRDDVAILKNKRFNFVSKQQREELIKLCDKLWTEVKKHIREDSFIGNTYIMPFAGCGYPFVTIDMKKNILHVEFSLVNKFNEINVPEKKENINKIMSTLNEALIQAAQAIGFLFNPWGKNGGLLSYQNKYRIKVSTLFEDENKVLNSIYMNENSKKYELFEIKNSCGFFTAFSKVQNENWFKLRSWFLSNKNNAKNPRSADYITLINLVNIITKLKGKKAL